jgi:D-alanyl-D-alanine carboxypeptidase
MRKAHALALLLIVGIGMSPAPAPAKSRLAPDPEGLAKVLQEKVEAFRSDNGLPGCVSAVALPDRSVIAAATGMADPEADLATTTQTRYMSGSIGKSFAAAVALALAQDRLLDLDAPISTWLGDEPWFDRLPNGPDITTRVLLQHASGLEDHVGTLEFALKAGWKRFVTDPHVFFDRPELVEIVLDRDPLFPAGEGYHYTDTGYILVGLIIEEAAGRSYYEELQRRFLNPLALELTSPATKRDLEGLAVGHTKGDENLAALARLFIPEKTVVDGKLVFDPNTEWTGGGLVTNPQDLVVWAKALYEGRALRGEYTRELLAPGYHPMPREVGDPSAYGLGVYMGTTKLGPIYGHGGYWPGFNSAMGYFPEHGLAAAVQVNSEGLSGETLQGHLVSVVEAILAEGSQTD